MNSKNYLNALKREVERLFFSWDKEDMSQEKKSDNTQGTPPESNSKKKFLLRRVVEGVGKALAWWSNPERGERLYRRSGMWGHYRGSFGEQERDR